MAGEPLVVLENATVARPGGAVALRGVTWSPREGETWAVVGPVGAGKTTLAETVYGRHRLAGGRIAWPMLEALRAAGRPADWPADAMRFVSFKEDSYLFSYADHYYQQRFEFADADDPLELGGFLRAGTDAGDGEVTAVADRLGLASLLPLSFVKLSNGQAKRARVARALLGRPALLILDDPFVGLDAAGRAELDRHLGELVCAGQRVLLICGREAVPAWVTHVLELERGTVRASGPKAAQASEGRTALPPFETVVPSGQSEPVVELNDVTVTHGGKRILDGVTWIVRSGERWALVGSNGAGKTTLLALICGDHPQAYANDVRLFGRRRGTGESVWDVKRRIGLVSPEFHLYFPGALTAFEAAVTGFFDVLAFREASPAQAAAVRDLFAAFGASHLAERPYGRLSAGEQRVALLVRALVKRPPLLVLDEPFQGLDGETVARVRDWLDAELRPEQTLIFVSHLPEEIPRGVSHRLELAAGRAVPLA